MKKLLITKRKKQSGFAMIEILLMIGVLIALAAVMVYALYSKVSRQSQNVQATTDVTNIVSSARDYITKNPVTCNLKGDCLPEDKKEQAIWGPLLSTYGLSNKLEQSGMNPWGGTYQLVYVAGESQLIVSMTGIPAYMEASGYMDSFNSSIGNLGDQNVDGVGSAGNITKCTFLEDTDDDDDNGTPDAKANKVLDVVTGNTIECTINV